MSFARRAAQLVLLVACVLASHSTLGQQEPQRLSAWLLRNAKADSYLPGIIWRVPEEEPAQGVLKTELLDALKSRSAPPQLWGWIASLPVTGRVSVIFPDPRWLMAHPDRDPFLLPGHRVVLPVRPTVVTVVTHEGERCSVTHTSNQEALTYVEICSPHSGSPADWVWVVQPDGRVQRYGVATWNREAQDEPAPGAWIWAPPRNEAYTELTSSRLAQFLSTQGPAVDPAGSVQSPPENYSGNFRRSSSATYYASDWGESGLLQTPTARIRPAGTLTFNLSHTWPYTNGNVFVSPFNWLEAGFRYTDIANQVYGRGALDTTQTYKDKSFDAKVRLLSESAVLPQIAIGARDLAGTGLFSAEYLVASKRFNNFDWSVGIGWGYLGASGNLANDSARESDIGQGGTFSYKSYFKGPWDPLESTCRHASLSIL